MSKEQDQLIEAVYESFPEQRNGVKLKNEVAQAIATAAVTSDSGIEEAADLFGYPEEARVALFDMCADYKTNKVLLALWTVYSGPPIVPILSPFRHWWRLSRKAAKRRAMTFALLMACPLSTLTSRLSVQL